MASTPPGDLPAGPWRLQAVPYQRSIPHVKHLGDFGQEYFRRQASRAGFDEALLTRQDGVISEGSVTNVGFFDGASVIWPEAPMLAGITMQLLNAGIGAFGMTSRRAGVMLADVRSFDGAFVTNARGIAAVAEIDGIVLPVDADRMERLTKAYASARATAFDVAQAGLQEGSCGDAEPRPGPGPGPPGAAPPHGRLPLAKTP